MKSLLHTFRSFGATKRGFTLMLAALIASVVLALGTSIFTIAQKQVMLSSIGRDSQFAFYAADTAAECALFWDLRSTESFPTPDETAPYVLPSVTCDGITPTDLSATTNGGSVVTTFTIQSLFIHSDVSEPGNCAEVTVTKNTIRPFTVIHADGYNVPCSQLNQTGRLLQRSVELKY